jgi:hypothetical protein
VARFTQGGGSSNNGGAALNYVQVEASQINITTSPQEVTSLTITTTGAPVQVGITGEGSNASAGSWVKLALYRDGTLIGQTIQIEASAVSENVPYALNYIDDVPAGTYVYSAKIVGKSSGNWQFGEVSGPVMNAVELTGFKGDTGDTGPAGADGADGSDSPKEYTADNEERYGTYQASGFTEVTTTASSTLGATVYAFGGASNDTSTQLSLGEAQHTLLFGNPYLRRITIYDETDTTRFLRDGFYVEPSEGGYLWQFNCDQTLSLLDATNYNLDIEHGGPPIIWWDADDYNNTNEEFVNSNFRGAKIEYHAYVSDGGTVIGTIYIANDSGDDNVTHIETSSGGGDVVSATFWGRDGGERELFLYRIDGEGRTHKIQWTAQMYYATEYYDD